MLNCVVAATVLATLWAPAKDLPERLRDLTDLQLLGQLHTPMERDRVVLGWLVAEIREPSKTVNGLGGPIDSSYLQAQLVRSFDARDPRPIMWLLDQGKAPAVLQAALRIALGHMGDPRQEANLRGMVRSDADAYRRMSAVQILQFCRHPELAKPALTHALNDPFSVVGQGSDVGPRADQPGRVGDRLYPVRGAAIQSLRMMNLPAVRADSARRLARFNLATAGYVEYVRMHRKDLFALAKII